MATNTRTAGLRRQAGNDDGRMYGMSDAGYQSTLRRLTAAQKASNEQANAAQYKSAEQRFMDGTDAALTPGQRICAAQLRARVAPGQEPKVVAVVQWSDHTMGCVAKAIWSEYGYGAVYVGDCAQVIDLQLSRGRKGSAHIAREMLRQQFPERSRQHAYNDKANACQALKEETVTAGNGRRLCFLDAVTLPFQDCDWLEAARIATACDAILIVSVKCEADAPDGVPVLRAPREQTARPRENIKRVLAEPVQPEPVQPEPVQPKRQLTPLCHEILAILNDPVAMRRITEPRRLAALSTLRHKLDELEYCGRYSGVRRQLPPQAKELVRVGRAILEEGGDYASDTEDEDECDADGDVRARVQLPGHRERCCKCRCVCPTSSGIDSNSGKTRRLG